jgi:type II secretory pathway component PulM
MSAAGPSQGANGAPSGAAQRRQPQAWGDHPSAAGARGSLLPASLVAAWDRASSRERRLAGIAAFGVIVAAGWALAWRPLQADIDRTREQLGRDAQTLARARALVDESAALSRAPGTVATGDPRAAITRAFAERDLPLGGSLEIRDGRVKVILPDARFDRLVAALDAVRRDQGLRAVEATLTARVEPGAVRAELTLGR